MKRIIYISCLLMLMLALNSAITLSSAAASTGGTRSTIVNFTDTDIPIDTTVHNIVVVGGNLTIAGNVSDEVVVINGNAILKPTANIHDRIVVIGGDIKAEDGSTVGKGIYRIGQDFIHGTTPASGAMIIAGVALLLLWLINIALSVALVAIPVLISLLWKNTTAELGDIVTNSKLKIAGIGILGTTVILSLIVLLCITGIGIPAAFLLFLFAFIAIFFGLAGVCLAFGRSLPGQWQPKHEAAQTLHGALLLIMLINLPIIGLPSLMLFMAAAMGSIIIKIFTKKCV